MPCEASGCEAYVGDVDPSLAGGDGFLPVLRQSAAAPEPCEGAFDDPSSWQDLEPLRGVGGLDDFEGLLSDPVEGAAQFRPGIGAIGEQVAQPGAGVAYGFQHGRRAVAILNVAGMNDEAEEHAGGIDDDMALAAPGSGSGAGF